MQRPEEDVGVFLYRPPLYCLETGSLIDLEAHCLGQAGPASFQDLSLPSIAGVTGMHSWLFNVSARNSNLGPHT